MKTVLKRFIKRLAGSRFRPVLKQMFIVLANAEYRLLNFKYMLQGCRMPDTTAQQYVRENVTFMYKSFERQPMARQLCKNIHKYYPGEKIVIADDSRKPLQIEDENVQIIQLPFNSGLSCGLNRALHAVKTPYLVKLDDDILLTRKTNIHKELEFLEENEKADLVGFGWVTAPMCFAPMRNAKQYFQITYNKPLLIPHLTKPDDRHTVVAKSQNTYLARTDKIRQVGWDDNIRMIDHNEFFYRAAGVIVSTIAPDAVLFHRHNPFEGDYTKFRGDFLSDLIYIRAKHSSGK